MYKEMFEHDELENLCEEIVFEQIHKLIEEGKHDFHKNPVTVQDIAAVALNAMPPKYVTSFMEKKFPRPGLQSEVNDLRRYARRQVLKAVKRVTTNPHD